MEDGHSRHQAFFVRIIFFTILALPYIIPIFYKKGLGRVDICGIMGICQPLPYLILNGQK